MIYYSSKNHDIIIMSFKEKIDFIDLQPFIIIKEQCSHCSFCFIRRYHFIFELW